MAEERVGVKLDVTGQQETVRKVRSVEGAVRDLGQRATRLPAGWTMRATRPPVSAVRRGRWTVRSGSRPGRSGGCPAAGWRSAGSSPARWPAAPVSPLPGSGSWSRPGPRSGLSLIGLASDAQESAAKYETVFGAAASRVTADLAAIPGATKDVQDAAAVFGVFGQSAGLAGGDLAEFASSMVTAGGDLGSFFNLDLVAVNDKLRAGLAGESEPLRDLGIFLTEARVAAEGARLGYDEELTEQEKVLARQSLILTNFRGSAAEGDLARTATSYANVSREFTGELADLGVRAGMVGTAFAEELLPPLADGLVSLNEWAGDALPRLELRARGFARSLLDVADDADELYDAFTQLRRGDVGGFRDDLDAMFGAGAGDVLGDLGEIGRNVGRFAGGFLDGSRALSDSLGGIPTSVLDALVWGTGYLADNGELLGAVLPPLGLGIGAVTAAQWGWNAAMAANPLGLIVGTALAGGTAINYLWQNSEGFLNYLDTGGHVVLDTFHGISGAILDTADTMLTAFLALPSVPGIGPLRMDAKEGRQRIDDLRDRNDEFHGRYSGALDLVTDSQRAVIAAGDLEDALDLDPLDLGLDDATRDLRGLDRDVSRMRRQWERPVRLTFSAVDLTTSPSGEQSYRPGGQLGGSIPAGTGLAGSPSLSAVRPTSALALARGVGPSPVRVASQPVRVASPAPTGPARTRLASWSGDVIVNAAPGQDAESIARVVGAAVDAKIASPVTRDRLEYGYARDAAGRGDRP